MEGNELKSCLVNLYDGKRMRLDCTSGFSIGRIQVETNKGLCIEDSIISREHARIIKEEGHYFIIDLKSKNGTKVNGIPLEPYKEYELSSYSLIEFSKLKYRFEIEKENELINLGYGTLEFLEINGRKKGCIELPSDIMIIEYQKEMLSYNTYHNLIDMSMLSSDKGSRVYYDLDNKISLNTMLQEKKYDKKDLIDLFFCIFEVLKQAERLLLNPEFFLFQTRTIFYKEGNQPCFIYLPAKRKENLLDQITSLLMELVSKHLNENDKAFKEYVLSVLSNKDMNLESIRSMIWLKEINVENTVVTEENKEIKKDKRKLRLKTKNGIELKYKILSFQVVLIMIFIGLKFVNGLLINQWIGIGILMFAIDAWIINSHVKRATHAK